jgi:hypothetical protein
MRVALYTTAVAFLLLFTWMVHLRTRLQRMTEELAMLQADLGLR